MKILKINHVGLVPKDLSQCQDFFKNILQIPYEGSEVVTEQKVAVDFFSIPHARLEVLAPTDSTSPIAKFLTERGSGIQHIALEVDNIHEWLLYLKKNNVQMIDENPRAGAHNTLIAFVHPRATGGLLIELVQEKK